MGGVLAGIARLMQWFTNTYLAPSEQVPFVWCFISIIFGVVILGVWAWERGQ